jgi:hypothetical protein
MRYRDAASFRQALEQRLQTQAAGDGARLARDRKRVTFERFLARLATAAPDAWQLKGGFALDLRLADRARTTRDIDLDWQATEDELLETLIRAAALDNGDYFSFQIERTGTPPDRLGGSHRFRVTATLAGRQFETFPLDVGLRSQPITEADTVTTSDLLAFADIDPVTVPAMRLELQVAEKLHAYTRSHQGSRPSTRVKDLVDLALIAELFPLQATSLCQAIATTFAGRAEHNQPTALPSPPADWAVPYRQLAQAVAITPELDAGHTTAAALLDPILDETTTAGTWVPDARRWNTERR